MAFGTVVSRLTGFARSALLIAALGAQLHADIFTIANTVPNMLYVLLAGGIFNTVLVPQLVRAMTAGPDAGASYVNCLITYAALVLGVVTTLLVAFAPTVMDLFLDGSLGSAALAEQHQAVIAFARLCLPQVFFYGMFVLVGQVLNAHGSFGPMMWAPVVNNLIAILTLGVYLVVFGPARGAELCGGYTTSQEWLLGLGSTAGIASQFLVLAWFFRASGLHFRPRLDLRGTGLRGTVGLGLWMIGVVLVNQAAYAVVVRLASSGTARVAVDCGAASASDPTAGYTVYSAAFLLMMVPHSVVTVSLATAMMPRLSALAHIGDWAELRHELGRGTRQALAVLIPVAMGIAAFATPLAELAFGYGAAKGSHHGFALALALFSPGLAFFTVHYLMLRALFAAQRHRTVFGIQSVIAVVNVGLALVAVLDLPPQLTVPALILAYAGAYAVGALLSVIAVSRMLAGGRIRSAIFYGARLAGAAGCAAGVAIGVQWLVHSLTSVDSGKALALFLVTSGGASYVASLWLAARLIPIPQLADSMSRLWHLGARLGRSRSA
jgi:putative peptidoglycan lipid II flippase